MSIKQCLEQVTTSARQGANPKTRIVTDLPYGKYLRQGDVYLRRFPLEHAHELELKPSDTRQLAPGTTAGSRHVVRPRQGVKVFEKEDAGPLDGPVVVAEEGFYLEHPKHADMDVRQPGCYEVTFPIDKEAEKMGEIRRRRD